MMEIATDITKVFGEEMARLFSNRISEEELTQTAQEIWNNLKNNNSSNYAGISYGLSSSNKPTSKIGKMIAEQIEQRVFQKVQEILNEPQSEEEIERIARDIVRRGKETGEEALVKLIASNYIRTSLYFSDEIESAINMAYAKTMAR